MSRTYVAAALACIVTQVGFGGYGIVLKMFAEASAPLAFPPRKCPPLPRLKPHEKLGATAAGSSSRNRAQAAHENAVIFSFFRDGCCFPVLLLAACISERHLRLPSSSQEARPEQSPRNLKRARCARPAAGSWAPRCRRRATPFTSTARDAARR